MSFRQRPRDTTERSIKLDEQNPKGYVALYRALLGCGRGDFRIGSSIALNGIDNDHRLIAEALARRGTLFDF